MGAGTRQPPGVQPRKWARLEERQFSMIPRGSGLQIAPRLRRVQAVAGQMHFHQMNGAEPAR